MLLGAGRLLAACRSFVATGVGAASYLKFHQADEYGRAQGIPRPYVDFAAGSIAEPALGAGLVGFLKVVLQPLLKKQLSKTGVLN
mgnify:CR=1 FL=1